ncbi:hypothetical protein BTR14_20555 [Rhizobium rhizosphaerae]|uniref:Uncharacterized protein n=1 Tax=Xaviernesmea rhizosphaerae TaxID=1672749 RepID=A0ABX3P814_9HYPH|nr:hypothetical protein [Xaviernesmea rhizosphaerae]OQP84196.1 hypothetical protein BTR14_20555 [Xaviernesmea rhizosphaerae]
MQDFAERGADAGRDCLRKLDALNTVSADLVPQYLESGEALIRLSILSQVQRLEDAGASRRDMKRFAMGAMKVVHHGLIARRNMTTTVH